MKRTYITPASNCVKLYAEDALMNTSITLSDEKADDVQWSQERQNGDSGMWQYLNNED